jgi:hypothetical protein
VSIEHYYLAILSYAFFPAAAEAVLLLLVGLVVTFLVSTLCVLRAVSMPFVSVQFVSMVLLSRWLLLSQAQPFESRARLLQVFPGPFPVCVGLGSCHVFPLFYMLVQLTVLIGRARLISQHPRVFSLVGLWRL